MFVPWSTILNIYLFKNSNFRFLWTTFRFFTFANSKFEMSGSVAHFPLGVMIWPKLIDKITKSNIVVFKFWCKIYFQIWFRYKFWCDLEYIKAINLRAYGWEMTAENCFEYYEIFLRIRQLWNISEDFIPELRILWNILEILWNLVTVQVQIKKLRKLLYKFLLYKIFFK